VEELFDEGLIKMTPNGKISVVENAREREHIRKQSETKKKQQRRQS